MPEVEVNPADVTVRTVVQIIPVLLTNAQVELMTGISERLIRAMVSAGNFPRPVQIPGYRLTRWRRSDVDQWVADLKR